MDVKKTVFEALYTVYHYRRELLKAIIVPLIAVILLDIAYELEEQPIAKFVFWLLSSLAYINVAITTHRMVLLGPGSVPEWGITRWTKREVVFVVYSIASLIVLICVSVPLGIIPKVGVAVAMLVGLWLLCRLSLVFPGVAVDEGVSFKLSWKLTRRHQFPMTVVLIIVPAALYLPSELIGVIPYIEYALVPVNMLATVLEIALLSMAYRYIKQKEYGSHV